MEHIYLPTGIVDIPRVGSLLEDWIEYNFQMKFRELPGITLRQLVPQISPEGKISAFWTGRGPEKDNYLVDKNVILRTTTQYDMPVLAPTIDVESAVDLKADSAWQDIYNLFYSNPQPWGNTSWRFVQTDTIGEITLDKIEKFKVLYDYHDECVWDKSKYGSFNWDPNLLIGKNIPLYNVVNKDGICDIWRQYGDIAYYLDLLFPWSMNLFIESTEVNPYKEELRSHINADAVPPSEEWHISEFVRYFFDLNLNFLEDNLAVSLDKGYAGFGDCRSISSEVLDIPLSRLYPYIITRGYAGLDKANKLFPECKGLFRRQRLMSISLLSDSYSDIFWKPRYNLYGVFDR